MPAVFRLQGSVNSAQGQALDGVDIFVCTQPLVSSAIPPSPLATLYTDSTGITVQVQPVETDGLGNWFTYVVPGIYTLVISDPSPNHRIPTTIFPDQVVVGTGSGSGSVTGVALTMPAEFSVAGSPITTSGTFAVTKSVQNPNTVYAGPASGGADVPAFRTLTSADISGLTAGTVTSVTLASSFGTLFVTSITGTNPITTSGTFTLNADFANQAANLVLAGPASGGTGNVTARRLVPGDLPLQTAVAFTPTPIFDASISSSFQIILTGNVTSSTLANTLPGELLTFIIKQDGTGSRTFVWPTNILGAGTIDATLNSVNIQTFIGDQLGNFYPIGNMITVI